MSQENDEDAAIHSDYQRDYAFHCLADRIHTCRRCPRMEGRNRVFGLKNGPIDAAILFIAEAPGRLGGDRSGIPLTSDQTGRNFERLRHAAQLERSDLFITNTVLCNPRDERGHNAPPTSQEIENCSDHLRETITLLQPRFVITLGQVALRALSRVDHHEIILSRDVGNPQQWNGRWLIPLYHPSPRAQIHRSFTKQLEDFRLLGTFIRSNPPL
jgi:uracil-DNA glycosylase family 4